jgi:hypothetical protein
MWKILYYKSINFCTYSHKICTKKIKFQYWYTTLNIDKFYNSYNFGPNIISRNNKDFVTSTENSTKTEY